MDNSALDTLKSLLGDNADDKIKSVLNTLSQPESPLKDDRTDEIIDVQNPDSNLPTTSSNLDISTIDSIVQIKDIIDSYTTSSNDSRATLLMSLKPFMRTSRKNSIDTAIKLLNLSKLSGLFKLR